MIYQCFILRLDCPGPFHKIMTVSNEKIDYILKQRVWQHSFNTAVTSQNNLIRRIFAKYHFFIFLAELEDRKLDLEGEVFDMLFTLTDFLAFKEMFVSYKVSKQESTSLSLQEILSVTSLGNSPPPTSVSDQA